MSPFAQVRPARRLKDVGLEVDESIVRARPNNKGPRHTIWFAKRPL